jgi:hypothetical protein
MLCNSIGQLQLSAGCSEYCRMHRACTGFVQHGNTAKYRLQACLTASTHANRHAIFECSAALTVQLRLFAIYSGCRMHRVCAACLETQVQPARSTTDATLSNRCSDLLACWAACLVLMQVFAASCWLLRCYCLHRVCAQANTARYSLLGMFDRVNTRKQACIRTYVHLAGFTTRIGQQRCLQAVLNTYAQGFVQHAITARYSLQHLFDGSNPSE